MKKLRGSLLAKITAIFLLVILAVGVVLSAVGTFWMAETEAYSASYQRAKSNALANMGRSRCYSVGYEYENALNQNYALYPIYEESNFLYNAYTSDGILIYKGYSGEAAAWSGSVRVHAGYDDNGADRYIVVEGYILENMVHEDSLYSLYFTVNAFNTVYSMRGALVVFAVAGVLLCIVLFIFLMCAAGHRDESDTITMNAIDRIPFDLFLGITGVGIVLLLLPTFDGFFGSSVYIWVVLAALLLLCAALLALMLCMSFATRMKVGSFTGLIKSCLIYKILRWCWLLLKKLLRAVLRLFGALPLLGRWGFALAGLLIVEFFLIIATDYELGAELFFWMLERLALIALLLYALLCIRSLRTGARELAAGNDSYKIDTRRMRGVFKEHAEDLNNIGTGIGRAVDERMKSEHLRTELITNVSHDIKTPLTSIVNYVDLLGKEEPENEKMREYIDVLSRQSARLKKLIDDLVEASKASTGNLKVNLQRCELGVLLDQTAGEYGERLSKAGLELVLTKPDEPVTIMADGRHMWRVFDNLMNNACKYAQPGTRIYLTLNRIGDRANIIFRNISHSMLNITGDELMERFVRGDSSRNTEGSGLGLSIARSLVQLQGGEMDLTLDGDLFKVTLSFKTVN